MLLVTLCLWDGAHIKYLDMYLPRLVVSTASTFLAVIILARERSVQALLALQVISKSATVEHRSK